MFAENFLQILPNHQSVYSVYLQSLDNKRIWVIGVRRTFFASNDIFHLHNLSNINLAERNFPLFFPILNGD